MLEELTVRNYALIDELHLRFGPGFNVLSGETGAGKSILVDALSLVLGSRGRSESVRQGSTEAEVAAVIQVENTPELREWCEKYAIEPEDGSLLIRRTLRPNGRGSASVQAVPVTRGALAELSGVLVDIHGQHEHQSLFQVSAHRRLLDRFANLETRVNEFGALFTEVSDISRRLDILDKDEGEMKREADFLRFAADEIESAELKSGEEEELAETQKRLARHEELSGSLERTMNASSESRHGALSNLRIAKDELGAAAGIDSSLTPLVQRLETAFFEIEDIVQEVRGRLDTANFDPAELEAVDARLARIGTLEKKYAAVSIDEVLEYAREARERLAGFENRDDERRGLLRRRGELQSRLAFEAAEISRGRKSAADSLRERTEAHLHSLGMAEARFTVELEGKRNTEGKALIGPYGGDTVEFLLSANRGEKPKPLKSTASGGELSRVMLALKTVLSESDTVPSMIFDEVDSGIGGEVARSVGEHLHALSKSKQIFCITHLASIAVFADNHFQVGKESSGSRTVTRVRRIDADERVKEVARMLAGNREDAASLGHAARLLEERREAGRMQWPR